MRAPSGMINWIEIKNDVDGGRAEQRVGRVDVSGEGAGGPEVSCGRSLIDTH